MKLKGWSVAATLRVQWLKSPEQIESAYFTRIAGMRTAVSPPSSGPHYPVWAPFNKKFYTLDDRPAIPNLVHNLEHGYTILWYDETIADDDAAIAELRAIADKLAGTSNLRTKFKAVPWTSEDEGGKKFPEGQHVAFTHWSVGRSGGTDAESQEGVWQYCSDVSGEALSDFMLEYPYTDSPEPGAA